MIINEVNKLSYIKHLMFREEFENMIIRNFSLKSDNPFLYDEIIISREKPPVISTEIIETYICYPQENDPFKINIRNIMIEQEAVNRIKVISDIRLPDNFTCSIITDEEEHIMNKTNYFTVRTPSIWSSISMNDKKCYHFSDTYYLAYREGPRGKQPEIVQLSDFDPYYIFEYSTNISENFELNLDYCNKIKWKSHTQPQALLKKTKNGIYKLY